MRFDTMEKVYLGVLMTSAFSVTLSVIITGMVVGDFMNPAAMIPATLVPLIVAPIVSLWGFRQSFKIEELNSKLANMVNHDALTGVHSRSYFFDHADNRAENSEAAVLMIDADNFKQINDTHGHEAGDQALRHIARNIARHCRRSDVVARLGGEEFAVYMADTSIQDAKAIAERIRESISQSELKLTDCSLMLSVSVGVASQLSNHTVHEAIKRADIALYEAKNSGRNLVCIESRRVEPQFFPPNIAAKLAG